MVSALCYGLVDKFWDTVYPELEDGDAQSRGAPLGFVGTKLEIPLKLVPVVEKAALQPARLPAVARRRIRGPGKDRRGQEEARRARQRRQAHSGRSSIRLLKKLRRSFTRRPSRIWTLA